MTPNPNPLEQRLQNIALSGLISGAIALGTKLNLFNALAEVSNENKHASPEEVASVAKCKPRYVREWLCLLAVADILCVDEHEKFWIAPENLNMLTTKNAALMYHSNVIYQLQCHSKVANVVKAEGPLGLSYSDFADFYTAINNFSESHHRDFVKHMIPDLDLNMHERLLAGGMEILDVGCGSGWHLTSMADEYPNSKFIGIDVTVEAINIAKEHKNNNIEIIEMDAGKMDTTWSNKFDVVFIFDACHDQMRPDLCLKEIHRVLKPGGVFAMLETAGTSNVYKDKQLMGQKMISLYGSSLFHCLPVASNAPDAIGAGAAWGSEMAKRMLTEAGFDDIRVVPTPEFEMNQLYICKKQL